MYVDAAVELTRAGATNNAIETAMRNDVTKIVQDLVNEGNGNGYALSQTYINVRDPEPGKGYTILHDNHCKHDFEHTGNPTLRLAI